MFAIVFLLMKKQNTVKESGDSLTVFLCNCAATFVFVNKKAHTMRPSGIVCAYFCSGLLPTQRALQGKVRLGYCLESTIALVELM